MIDLNPLKGAKMNVGKKLGNVARKIRKETVPSCDDEKIVAICNYYGSVIIAAANVGLTGWAMREFFRGKKPTKHEQELLDKAYRYLKLRKNIN